MTNIFSHSRNHIHRNKRIFDVNWMEEVKCQISMRKSWIRIIFIWIKWYSWNLQRIQILAKILCYYYKHCRMFICGIIIKKESKASSINLSRKHQIEIGWQETRMLNSFHSLSMLKEKTFYNDIPLLQSLGFEFPAKSHWNQKWFCHVLVCVTHIPLK